MELGYTDFGSVNRAGGRTTADGINLAPARPADAGEGGGLLGASERQKRRAHSKDASDRDDHRRLLQREARGTLCEAAVELRKVHGGCGVAG